MSESIRSCTVETLPSVAAGPSTTTAPWEGVGEFKCVLTTVDRNHKRQQELSFEQKVGSRSGSHHKMYVYLTFAYEVVRPFG
jgi:hypothetical protein